MAKSHADSIVHQLTNAHKHNHDCMTKANLALHQPSKLFPIKIMGTSHRDTPSPLGRLTVNHKPSNLNLADSL